MIGGVAREGTLATRLRPRPIRVISSVQVSALGGDLLHTDDDLRAWGGIVGSLNPRIRRSNHAFRDMGGPRPKDYGSASKLQNGFETKIGRQLIQSLCLRLWLRGRLWLHLYNSEGMPVD